MTTGVIASLPILPFFLNNGELAVNGSILTQVGGVNAATYADSGLTTPLPNPIPLNSRGEISDAAGNSKQLFLTPNTVYTFTFYDGPNGTGNQIWQATYVNGVQIADSSFSTLTPWKQTAAEIAASVTPTNYAYAPGDLRRYGATLNGNLVASLSAAINQAQQTGGAVVYWPWQLGTGCTINSSLPAINTPIVIRGDGPQVCYATCTDVTVFTINVNGSGTLMSGFQLNGPGVGAVNPAILYTNANNCLIDTCWIAHFGINVEYATGANSSYLNTIRNSRINGSNNMNIYAQAQTNALLLEGVTFGSGPIGLYMTDSTALCIIGGDCEGCTTNAIKLDASSPLFANHTIVGLHMEGNNTSAGDISIGATSTVQGVAFLNVQFGPNGTNGAINAINCSGLLVRGQMGTSNPFLKKTNLTNEDIQLYTTTGNVPCYNARTYKANYGDEGSVTQRSALFIDGNYQDCLTFGQYQIMSGSAVAGKDYYGGIDLIELGNGTATAANVKLYARFIYALNSKGDSTKVGAAKIVGDVDASSGAWSFGSNSSGAITNNATITTANTRIARVQPAGSVTGIILQAGTIDGQRVTVINQSTNTVTFAAAGTSNVADGATSAIPANCSRTFNWATSSALWFRDA